MILIDINLLIHAYDPGSPRHTRARAWYESELSGTEQVGLAWIALLGFIRLTTNRHVFATPLSPGEACQHVRAWLGRPHVTVVHPGDRHAEILFGLIAATGTAGNLTTDAHLAALAIEYQAEIRSTDADFSRFPGVRWANPIE